MSSILAVMIIVGAGSSLVMMRRTVRWNLVDVLTLIYLVSLHLRFTDGRSGAEAFGAVQAMKLLVWTAPLLLVLAPDRGGRRRFDLPRNGAAAFTLYLLLALCLGTLVGPTMQNLVGVVWLAAGLVTARYLLLRHGIGGMTAVIATAICIQTIMNGVWELGIDLAGLAAPPQLASLLGPRRLIGIGVHTNLVGRNGALLVLIAAFSPVFRRWPVSSRLPLLCTGSLVLLWSSSRSSIIAVVGTLAVVAALQNAKNRSIALTGAGVALLAAFVSNVSISALQASYGRNGQADELTTLTGRTDVWAIAWREALHRPLTGQGFAGSIDGLRQIVELETGLPWATHAHNWFLQTFHATGIVGLSLVLFAALSVARVAIQPGTSARFVGAIGVFTLVIGLTESPLGLLQTFLPAIMWMGCLIASSSAPDPLGHRGPERGAVRSPRFLARQ